MKTKITLSILTILLGNLFAINAFAQSPIQPEIIWDYNGKAEAKGTGCNAEAWDTLIIAAGPQITVLFNNLGIHLEGDMVDEKGRLLKQQRSDCKIDIPFSVSPGFYFSELRQSILFGWIKSLGTLGQIQIRTKLFNRNAKPINILLKKDVEGMEPYWEEVGEDLFNIGDVQGCRNLNRPTRGNLTTVVELSGKRTAAQQYVLLEIDGVDYRLDIEGEMRACQENDDYEDE